MAFQWSACAYPGTLVFPPYPTTCLQVSPCLWRSLPSAMSTPCVSSQPSLPLPPTSRRSPTANSILGLTTLLHVTPPLPLVTTSVLLWAPLGSQRHWAACKKWELRTVVAAASLIPVTGFACWIAGHSCCAPPTHLSSGWGIAWVFHCCIA